MIDPEKAKHWLEDLKPFREARAIPDEDVVQAVRNSLASDGASLFNSSLRDEYVNTFRSWLQTSRLNNLTGLEPTHFPIATYVHGTSQCFDFFLKRHHARTVRFFKGEFVYHRIFCRDFSAWAFIEDREISKDDCVIVSLPFSDTGGKHAGIEALLDRCGELKIPVLIDGAYFGICKDIDFDFSHPAIESVTFSLSKAFVGAAHARIGLRLERDDRDDPVNFMNSVNMFSHPGAHLGIQLMRQFDIDFIPRKYSEAQAATCAALGLTPSPCVIFGIGDKKFASLNRGGASNRACLSSVLPAVLTDLRNQK